MDWNLIDSQEEIMNKEIFYLMRVFCTVVESGSFSSAADELGVQAPAVSKAITKLEGMLGKRLLNRSTRFVETSEVGRYFYEEASEQLSFLSLTLETIESWNSTVKGSLKITATPAIGEGLVSNIISEFCNRYPSVSIDLMFANEVIKLPSQNIDIALRSSNLLEDSSLISKKLFSVKRMVVAAPNYIKKYGNPENVDDLIGHKFLNFKHKKNLNSWPFTQRNKQSVITTKASITCNNYSSLRNMCIQGLGVARLFEYQIKQELEEGKLIQLLPNAHWGEQTIHAIYQEKMSDSPKVKAFIECIQSSSQLGN